MDIEKHKKIQCEFTITTIISSHSAKKQHPEGLERSINPDYKLYLVHTFWKYLANLILNSGSA